MMSEILCKSLLVAVMCMLAGVSAQSAVVINSTNDFTIFGLHNNDSQTENITVLFDSWITSSIQTHSTSWQPGDRITSVQVLVFFLLTPSRQTNVSQDDENVNSLLASLLSIWESGSVPLLQVLPSYDPEKHPNAFNEVFEFLSDCTDNVSYNDLLLFDTTSGATVCGYSAAAIAQLLDVRSDLAALVRDVLVPFLFPLLSSNVSTPKIEGLSSSRRLYLYFAPSFNSYRFPWGASFSYESWQGENSAESYAALWTTLLVPDVIQPLQSLLSEMNAIDAAGDISDEGGALDIRQFAQLIWGGSTTQLSDVWLASGSLGWASWLPSWDCSWAVGDSSSTVCGPDWFALGCVNLDATMSDPVTLLRDSVQALINLSVDVSKTWNRPLSPSAVVPLALVDVGTVAEAGVIGGVERKDTWVYDLLEYAFRQPLVRLVVPQNTLHFVESLGTAPQRVHLQMYSLDDPLCCDGGDPATGAGVLNKVSAAVLDAADASVLVFVRPPLLHQKCFQCRLLDDGVFMGLNYSRRQACTCEPPMVPQPSGELWIIRVIKDPIVLSCLGATIVIAAGFVYVRKRHSTAAQVLKRRMILGRYVVKRILQHPRQFSSVLVAYDTVQCVNVIVKQYVLSTDAAIALANNEIEKYRACAGFPHIVQLVQSTFAWKHMRRPSVVTDNNHTSGQPGLQARLLPDPSRGTMSHDQRRKQRSLSAVSNHVVLNDANAAKLPFAIVVMKKYSSGDMRNFIETVKETHGNLSDPHSGLGFHDFVSLLTQLCLALHTIHYVVRPGDPMLHRDVKPENIFLERRPLRQSGQPASARKAEGSEGTTQYVYLAHLGDFGCAVYESQLHAHRTRETQPEERTYGGDGASEDFSKPTSIASPSLSCAAQDVRATHLGTRAVGTSRFMSPEARRGEYSPANDIWSAGCTMLFAALRDVPADYCAALADESYARSVRAYLSRDAIFPAWVAETVLCKMVHFEPQRRSSAEEILRVIRVGVTGSPIVDAALRQKRSIQDLLGEPSPTQRELEDTQGEGIESPEVHSSRSANASPMSDRPSEGVLGRRNRSRSATSSQNEMTAPLVASDASFVAAGYGPDESLLVLDDDDIAETAESMTASAAVLLELPTG